MTAHYSQKNNFVLLVNLLCVQGQDGYRGVTFRVGHATAEF